MKNRLICSREFAEKNYTFKKSWSICFIHGWHIYGSVQLPQLERNSGNTALLLFRAKVVPVGLADEKLMIYMTEVYVTMSSLSADPAISSILLSNKMLLCVKLRTHDKQTLANICCPTSPVAQHCVTHHVTHDNILLDNNMYYWPTFWTHHRFLLDNTVGQHMLVNICLSYVHGLT